SAPLLGTRDATDMRNKTKNAALLAPECVPRVETGSDSDGLADRDRARSNYGPRQLELLFVPEINSCIPSVRAQGNKKTPANRRLVNPPLAVRNSAR
ncbi:MAG: hypothetical protein ACK52S_09195, partial [Pirellula sp.]